MNIFTKSGLAALALAALAAGPAAAAEEVCRTEPIIGMVQYPATPAVTEVRLVPAVTGEELVPAVYGIEYEYIQRASQEGQPGKGAGTRWEAPGWNADDNPQSNGWIRTGAERQVVLVPAQTRTIILEPAREELVVISPEIPAYTNEEVVGGQVVCEPAPAAPAPAAPAAALPAPEVPAATPAPAAAAGPSALPAELAYTGAKEDALLATAVGGVLLLAAGAGTLYYLRPRKGAHRAL